METKDILKKLRKDNGFATMQEFCTAANISFSTYQNYESGKRLPTAEILMQIAKFYGVTTDYLLGMEKAPDPFGELNLSTEDEQEVFAKYMSLPESVRAMILDVMVKLGDAARARRAAAQDTPELTETTTAGAAHDRLAEDAAAEESAG